MEGLKKTTSCMIVVCLLISAGLIPVVSASIKPIMLNETVNNDFVEGENHPAFYNVTIIRSYGFTREKIMKQVSYEDAMEIKKEFKNIDDAKCDICIKKNLKNEILKKYGIIEDFPLLDDFRKKINKNKMKLSDEKIKTNNINCYNSRSDNDGILCGPIGYLSADFYGLSLNMINLFVLGLPLYIVSDQGGSFWFLIFFLIPSSFETESPLEFFSLLFFGEIRLIPFIDPDGGSIEGICVVGAAFEQ